MSDPPPTKQDVERARELEAQLLPMMTRHDRIPAIAQALTAEYERGRREERFHLEGWEPLLSLREGAEPKSPEAKIWAKGREFERERAAKAMVQVRGGLGIQVADIRDDLRALATDLGQLGKAPTDED